MMIEIFRTGEYNSTNGPVKFTEEDLDRIVANYDDKEENQKAPLVHGHPINNEPAVGWVEKVKRYGNLLMAKVKNLSQDTIDLIKSSGLKNVSVCLHKKYDLVHVGLLGSSRPAVKGLEPLSLSLDVDENELIILSQNDNVENQIILKREKELDDHKNNLTMENYFEKSVEKGIISPNAKDKIINYISKLPENLEFEEKFDIGKELEQLVKMSSNLTDKMKFNDNVIDNELLHSSTPEGRMYLHEQATRLTKEKEINYSNAINELLNRKD
jgi:uncharacterized protein (UPF0332 family)